MGRRRQTLSTVTLSLSIAVAMWMPPPARAELESTPVVRAATVVGPSQRLLLVFQYPKRFPGMPKDFRVVDVAADGAPIEQALNQMESESYVYMAAIPISSEPPPPPIASGPGVASDARYGGVAGAPEQLLLVFRGHDRVDGRPGGYRVAQSSTRADDVERLLNEMASEVFYYHTAIVLAATTTPVARLQAVQLHERVGVPGFTSNILGDGTILPSGEVRMDATPWVRRVGSGSEYRVIRGGTWAQCEAKAREQGAHLVTIGDADEQEWLATTYADMRFLWIGFTDEGAEGVWRWASGEQPGYTNWAASTHEPSNQWEGGENFAHMNWGPDGAWNDLGPSSLEWDRATHGIIERAVGE